MNYVSERDIQDIVARVLAQQGVGCGAKSSSCGQEIPVEISARHVHLDEKALETLFGKGAKLTPKRDLSQPGQYLCEERIKLVTTRGQIENVAILGPVRAHTQVELSLTDARILGVKAPIRLSGDLSGAADVILVGPKGIVEAKGSVIVAKAHVHMTAEDARRYGVRNGDTVRIRMGQERPVTLENVLVRAGEGHALAVHIDYDEANAAGVSGTAITGYLMK